MGLQTRLLLLAGSLLLLSYFATGQSGQSFYYFYRPNQPMFVNAQTYGTQRQEQSSYEPSPATFLSDFQNFQKTIAPTRIRQHSPATYSQHVFEPFVPALEKVFANQPRRVESLLEPSKFPSFYDQPFQYFHQKSNALPQQQYYTPQQQTVYQQQLSVSSTPLSVTRPQQYFNYRIVPPTAQAEFLTESRNNNEFGRKPISNSIPLADPVPYEVQQYYSTVHKKQGSTGYSFSIGMDNNDKPTSSVSVNLGPSIFTNDGEPYEGHTHRLRAIANNRGEYVNNNYNSYSNGVQQNQEKMEQDEMEKMELKKIVSKEIEKQEEIVDTVTGATPVTSTATSTIATTVETTSTFQGNQKEGDIDTVIPNVPEVIEITSTPKQQIVNKNQKVARKRIRVRGRNKASTTTKKESDEPRITSTEEYASPLPPTPEVTTVISISTTTEKVITTTVAERRPTKPALRRRIKVTPALTDSSREPTSTNSIADQVDTTTINPTPVITEIINSFPQPSTKITILPSRTTTTTTTEVPEITSELVDDNLPRFDEPATTVTSTTEKNIQSEIFTTKTPETVTMLPFAEEDLTYPRSDEDYEYYDFGYPESHEILSNNNNTNLSKDEITSTTPVPVQITPRIFRAKTITTTEGPIQAQTPVGTTLNYDSTEIPTERSLSPLPKESFNEHSHFESTTDRYFNVEPLSTTEKPFDQDIYTTTKPSTTESLPEVDIVFDENIGPSTTESIAEQITTTQPIMDSTRSPYESTTVADELPSSTDSTLSSTTTSTTELTNTKSEDAPDYDNVPVAREISIDDNDDKNETSTTVSSTTEKDVKQNEENDLEIPSDEVIYSDEYDSELPSESEEKIGQAQRMALENTLKKLRSRVRNSTTETPEISSTESTDGDNAARKFIRKPVSEFTNSNSNRAVYHDDPEDSDKNSRSQIIQKIQRFRTNKNTNSVRSTTKRPRRVTRPSSRLIFNQVQLVDENESSINSKSRQGGRPTSFVGRSISSNVVVEQNINSKSETSSADSAEVKPQELPIQTTTTTTTTTTQAPRQRNPPAPETNSFEENEELLQKNINSDEKVEDTSIFQPISTTTTRTTTTTESTSAIPPPQTPSPTPIETSSSITKTEETNAEEEADHPIISTTVSNMQEENNEKETLEQSPAKIDSKPEITTEKIINEVTTKNEENKTEEITQKPFVGERKGRVTKIRRKIISRLIIHEILPTPGPVTTTTTSTTTTTTEAPISPILSNDFSDSDKVYENRNSNPRVRRLRKKTNKKEHLNQEIVPQEEQGSTTTTTTTENINIFGQVTQTILNSTSVVISSGGDEDDIIFATAIPEAEDPSSLHSQSFQNVNEKSNISVVEESKLTQPIIPRSHMKVRRVLKKKKVPVPLPA